MPEATNRPLAVVTGAAGGMGVACAAALAPRADLLLTDLDRSKLEDAVRGTKALRGARVEIVAGDLAASSFVPELAERAHARGGVRWLVHTAGLSPAMAGWSDVLEVDLAATAVLLDRLGPRMKPGGAAVCFASIAGHLGTDDPAIDAVLDAPLAPDLSGRLRAAVADEPSPGIAYLWAKRGVIRLCERLAVSWGARGVRIVSLSPGLMDTAMGRLELVGSPGKEPLLDLVPLVRPPAPGQSRLPGRADDVAAAVGFLCSDAASFVTGCDLRVDGGLIAAMR